MKKEKFNKNPLQQDNQELNWVEYTKNYWESQKGKIFASQQETCIKCGNKKQQCRCNFNTEFERITKNLGIKIITTKDKIVNRVIEKLSSRSNIGVQKYNSTIWDNTDENYIKHLQEELLDGANYCEQMLRLGEFTTKIIKLIESEPNDQSLGQKIRAEYQKLIKE